MRRHPFVALASLLCACDPVHVDFTFTWTTVAWVLGGIFALLVAAFAGFLFCCWLIAPRGWG